MSRFLNGSKMLKKGVVAIQFNWILVLIIGGLILLLFMSIVQKQKQLSEEDIAGTIQTDLQAILTSSQVSTGTASIVEMPNKEIKFDCRTGKPGFVLGNQNPATFPYAFAPDLIKSDRSAISVYAYDWSVPYRVTNFLYVTSPDIRYIILKGGSDELADALEGILPPQYITKDGQQKLFMKRESVDSPPSDDQNNYKIRYIQIGATDIILADLPRSTNTKDISILKIDFDTSCGDDPEDKLDCYGTLTFKNYKNGLFQPSTSYFVGKAALLAAIFSENQELYECGMNNSLKRLKSISEVYSKKASALGTPGSGLCETYYASAAADADNIGFVSDISSFDQIYNAAANLKLTNENLFESSCPPLY